jgi:hypothetical protein
MIHLMGPFLVEVNEAFVLIILDVIGLPRITFRLRFEPRLLIRSFFSFF